MKRKPHIPAPATEALDVHPAEVLLGLAHRLNRPGQLIECTGCDGHVLAVGILALEFQRRGAGFHLRALVEEWDKLDVVREVY